MRLAPCSLAAKDETEELENSTFQIYRVRWESFPCQKKNREKNEKRPILKCNAERVILYEKFIEA